MMLDGSSTFSCISINNFSIVACDSSPATFSSPPFSLLTMASTTALFTDLSFGSTTYSAFLPPFSAVILYLPLYLLSVTPSNASKNTFILSAPASNGILPSVLLYFSGTVFLLPNKFIILFSYTLVRQNKFIFRHTYHTRVTVHARYPK